MRADSPARATPRRMCARTAPTTLAALLLIAASAGPTETSAQTPPVPEPLEGQPRSWRLALWAQSGIMQPLGHFATNAPENLFGPVDVRAELERAPVLAGGLEVRFPAKGFSFRASWERTMGGKATGFPALCELLDECPDETTSSTVTGFVVEARSSRAGPVRRVAPLFAIGLGRRWYGFGDVDCSDHSDDRRPICNAIAEIFQNPGSHTIIRASAGIGAHLGRLHADLVAAAAAGTHSGGEGLTEGLWHPDLRFAMSVGAVMF